MRVSEMKCTGSKGCTSRGVKLGKSTGTLSWGSNGVWMGFPGDYFRSGERGLCGALAMALGRWVLEDLSEGSPLPLWTAQDAPGPWGSGGGLFHFKVKICRLWETIFKKVYNLHMPLNGGSSIYSGR